MRRRLSGARARIGFGVGLALLVVLTGASPASAAPATDSLTLPIAGVGDLLSGIANTVLGGVDWTVNVAGDFILNLLGGLVRDLIPRSWIDKGLDILGWLVAVPDYTARVRTPTGDGAYGFAGVNAMRGLYLWLGMAIAPLTLVYATSRAWTGQGDPPHVPLARMLIVAVALLSYGWLWSQAVALTNQITHAILGVSAVTTGVQKMFEVVIGGVALGGLPLVGLLLMGLGGLQLLALLFVKVALILVGALVFAIGPLMIGLVATERGNAFARTWLTLAGGLFVLPVLWASLFAAAAVLINDAGRGASVIGGNSDLGEALGGLLIAMAAIAGFWLNIKLTRGFAGLVGGQLAGLLALTGGGARALVSGGSGRGGSGAAGGGSSAPGGAAGSLRGFGGRVGGATAGAAGALVPAGRAGAALTGVGTLARGGLIGAGGALASKAITGAAGSTVGRAAASSRAGSVATRVARGARSGSTPAASRSSTADQPADAAAAPVRAAPAHDAAAPQPARPARPSPTATATGPSAPPPPRDGRPAGQGSGRSGAPRPSGATPPASGSARPPTPTPTGGGPAGDASHDAVRCAFGQRPVARPTRSVRHPFRGGRRS